MARGVSNFSTGEVAGQRLRNIAANVKFELEGDWVRASRMMDTLPSTLRKAIYAGQIVFANAYLLALQTNILENGARIGWEPLKKHYRYHKKQNKDRIGFYRGYMYNNIKIFKNPVKSIVSVGISKNSEIRGIGDLSLSQYVNVFEHGSLTHNVSARPLFGPTFISQMGGQKGASAMVIGSIKASLVLKYNIKT